MGGGGGRLVLFYYVLRVTREGFGGVFILLHVMVGSLLHVTIHFIGRIGGILLLLYKCVTKGWRGQWGRGGGTLQFMRMYHSL